MMALLETDLALIEDGSWDPDLAVPTSGQCTSPHSYAVKRDTVAGLQVTIGGICYTYLEHLFNMPSVTSVELLHLFQEMLAPADSSIEQYAVKSSVQRFDATPHFEKTGYWSEKDKLKTTDDDLYINELDGFNGKHFIFGSIEVLYICL